MLEKWIEKGTNSFSNRYGAGLRRAFLIPARAWILVLILLLVSAKPVLNSMRKPAHLRETIAECVSAASFYGVPTVDQTGKRLAYWRDTATGKGLFVYDSFAGKSRLIREFEQGTDPPDSRRSCLLPWSSDENSFAYTYCVGPMEDNVQEMLIWNAATGETDVIHSDVIARMPTANSFFSWVTSDSFVYFDAELKLHQVRKRETGNWEDSICVTLPPGQKAPSFVTAVSTTQIVWLQDNTLWTLNMAPARVPQKYCEFDTNKLGAITGISYSQPAARFLLSCQKKEGGLLWSLPVDDSSASPLLIKTNWSIRNAVSLNGIKGFAYVDQKRRFQELTVQAGTAADPIRLFTRGEVAGMAPSGDGSKLFVLGVTSNDFAPGIWKYDVAAASLDCILPGLEHPKYATRSVSMDGQLVLASGRKIPFFLTLPPHFDRHQNRRYPLVLAGTYLGYNTIFANCDVIHAYVTRPNWDDNAVEKWKEDTWELYQYLANAPFVDKDRVFLGSVSAETQVIHDFLIQHPDSWRGVMLLNPTVLPDLATLGSARHAPAILISAGTMEGGKEAGAENEKRFKWYQEAAAKVGVRVDVFMEPGADHAFVSQQAIGDRMRCLMNFIFED